MTDANTLKPLVQMMLDVSNGKGQFEKADLEVIRDNAQAIQTVIADDFQLSAKQIMDMWDAAKQAAQVEGVSIDVPKSVAAESSRGRTSPSALTSAVDGISYAELAEKAKSTAPRERY